jgi:hypothetical protein
MICYNEDKSWDNRPMLASGLLFNFKGAFDQQHFTL